MYVQMIKGDALFDILMSGNTAGLERSVEDAKEAFGLIKGEFEALLADIPATNAKQIRRKCKNNCMNAAMPVRFYGRHEENGVKVVRLAFEYMHTAKYVTFDSWNGVTGVYLR